MNRQTITIYGLVSALVGIIAVAGLMYNESEADITNESKAEIFNFIAENYVSQSAFDAVIFTLENHSHDEFVAIGDRFTTMEKAHKNLMAMVVTEETTDDPTPNAVNKFGLATDPEWKRGDLISVTGLLPMKSTLTAVVTHETDADFNRTFNIAVFDDGSFTMPFVIANDSPLGDYMVSFKSSGLRDSITFEIIE